MTDIIIVIEINLSEKKIHSSTNRFLDRKTLRAKNEEINLGVRMLLFFGINIYIPFLNFGFKPPKEIFFVNSSNNRRALTGRDGLRALYLKGCRRFWSL